MVIHTVAALRFVAAPFQLAVFALSPRGAVTDRALALTEGLIGGVLPDSAQLR
jgi:hypothetical protein